MSANLANRATRPFPAGAYPPLTRPDAGIDAALTNRLHQLMDLRRVSVSELAEKCDLPIEQVIAAYDGTAPLTLAQAVAFSTALDLHLMALIDGITTTPAFIHPALMDREAGDIALRVAQLPSVGRALVLALVQRGADA